MSEVARGWIPYKVEIEDIKKAIQKLYNYDEPLQDNIKSDELGTSGFIYYKDRMIFYCVNGFSKGNALLLDNDRKINAGKDWVYLSLGANEEGQKIIKDLIEVFGGYYDYNDCQNDRFMFINSDKFQKRMSQSLEKEIKFKSEPKKKYKIKIPPIKLNMNRVLDLIMAHYHYVTTGSDAEWDRQLKGFVNAIPDEKIREHFKRQITFFGDQEKLLFYGWGQEV